MDDRIAEKAVAGRAVLALDAGLWLLDLLIALFADVHLI